MWNDFFLPNLFRLTMWVRMLERWRLCQTGSQDVHSDFSAADQHCLNNLCEKMCWSESRVPNIHQNSMVPSVSKNENARKCHQIGDFDDSPFSHKRRKIVPTWSFLGVAEFS
jgi:hypothetical protein